MKCFLLYLILFGLPSFAFSQYSIKGVVLDAESNLPLEFATVFINNTTLGKITERDGSFEIQIPEGNYELIISFVGYQTFSYSFNTLSLAEFYTFKIFPEIVDLEEAQVLEKRDEEWYVNLEIFTKFFLGTSINAERCRIVNPEVLILDNVTDEKVLMARAKEALEIQNPNLGYTIKYVLEGFEYNFENNATKYAGYPFFIEQKSNKRKQKSIDQQRKKAFNGSINHFIRALYHDNLQQQGFEIYGSEIVPNLEKPDENSLQSTKMLLMEAKNPMDRDSLRNIISKESLPDEIEKFSDEPIDRNKLVEVSRNDLLFLTYKEPVFIVFLDEYEEPGYRDVVDPRSFRESFGRIKIQVASAEKQQVSKMKMLGKAVQIFENGSYFHPFDIYIEGYMAWEKIADLMPFDYGYEIGK